MNQDIVMNDKNNIIYETFVKYKNSKSDYLLNIANNNIIIYKKKGILNKKFKETIRILIDDIKIVGNKIKVEQKKNTIKISTFEEDYVFELNSVIDAKKLKEEIIKTKTGTGLLERTSKKVLNVSNIAQNSIKVVGGVATAFVGTYKIVKDNKKVFKDVAKTVKNIIKK